VVAGYVTGAGTNTVLQFFPAFKTQRIGRYLAAASFGVTGAFYGARSAARACLERLVTLDDSKLGEYAADIVRKNAPNDPMLAKAPSPASAGGFDTVTARAVTGDTMGNDDAGGSFRERVLREGRRREAERGVQTGRERRDAARREDLGRPAADGRRTADIRADAEAEARRRVREREREHTSGGEHRSVVDLSDEPSEAASKLGESSRVGTSSMDASAGFDRVFRDPLVAAGMRRGDAWGTVDDDAHGSDDKRKSSASEQRSERRMEWTRRRKERIRRGVDALSPFEGEEARATPDMFDASEFAARREGERTRKARPRATVRTEYGDVMDR
jgi:hypothetical protein